MFESISQIFKQKELRSKLIYTLIVIVFFRLGCAITVPFLNPTALKSMVGAGQSSDFLSYLNVLTGGALADASIFALSITPYINASIIIQLLTIAIPYLERLQKEGGEEGQKKLQRISRYTTLGLALLMGWAYYMMLKNASGLLTETGFIAALVIIMTFTGGACLVMWLGEQIDKQGIGNGISMILFAGIISRLPVRSPSW